MKRILLVLALPITLCVVWQAAVSLGGLQPTLFPSPARLAAALWQFAKSGQLLEPLQTTLLRTIHGLWWGTLAGVICGLAAGTNGLRMVVEPSLSALAAAPKIALLPLLMLAIGLGRAPGDILIALAVFIPVSVQALDAIRGVDRGLIELALNYGANRWDLLRRVYFPASLPRLLSGVRLGVGQALVLTISIEMIQAQGGLGGMIWLAWQTFDVERLYSGVLIACLAGAACYAALRQLERMIVPWRNSDDVQP